MRVTVRFFALVKAAAGQARRELDLPDGAVVAEAVRSAVGGNASLARLLIDENGEVTGSVLLFLGEDSVSIDDDRPLKEGDVIDIMSPISGG